MAGRIAVVGAGIAGIACARRLQDGGRDVELFEKSRGVGGRVATRRVSFGDLASSFDHGAQFLTARGDDFRAATRRWLDAGVVGAWSERFCRWSRSSVLPMNGEDRLVGIPTMTALPKALAVGLALHLDTTVTGLVRQGRQWWLQAPAGRAAGPFDAVVLAVPGEQAEPLLRPVSRSLADDAARSIIGPCWAGMFAFESSFDPGYDAARIESGGPIGWMAREFSKPGRRDAHAWTVHATPEWSAQMLESSPQTVSRSLEDALRELVPSATRVRGAAVHRWRYAQVTAAVGSAFGWDGSLRLGTCGDWRLGPRVELAWRSGDALGAALLSEG